MKWRANVEHVGIAQWAVCVGCALAVMMTGTGALAVTVRADHPRLLVTKDDLPRVKAQVAKYPDLWERMKGSALSEPSDPGYGDGRAIRNAAFVYLVTGEEQYLKSAAAMATNIARNHKPDQYGTPEALFGLALGYDWLYPGLTEAQRKEFAEAMLRMSEYCRDKIWRHSDFNNHFALEKVWPFTYTGLALHGDVADPRVDEFLKAGETFLKEQLIPAANIMAGNSGGQLEGYGYDSWGYARPMAYVMEAWRTATGEDLFPSCTETKYDAIWDIYGRRPFDGRQEHFDDAGLEQRWGAEDVYVYLFARRYGDGYAQWMGDQMPRRYDSYLWATALWRDSELTPQPPTDLPTARLFDAMGWVQMRSSWEPDATFASFQSGPLLTGHQHLDNNAFTIHKGGLLAIDPGINAYGERIDDKYRANYYSRTIAHNTITVFDPKETFPDGAWGGGDPKGANDGGQIRGRFPERAQEVTPGDQHSVGKITAYMHDPLFTYVVGDATKSYSPAKMKLFVRHFLFLPPNVSVVFDEVQSTDASFRKAWLLHTVNEPVVKGDLTTVTNGEARMVCRTVLPKAATFTTIGGPGKEQWVDGRNWPSLEKKEWPPEAGSWRAEVSPSTAAKDDLFLNVIQVGGDEIANAGAVELVQENGQTGVRVKAQGREYVVTFAKGGAGAHLKVSEGGKVVAERELK